MNQICFLVSWRAGWVDSAGFDCLLDCLGVGLQRNLTILQSSTQAKAWTILTGVILRAGFVQPKVESWSWEEEEELLAEPFSDRGGGRKHRALPDAGTGRCFFPRASWKSCRKRDGVGTLGCYRNIQIQISVWNNSRTTPESKHRQSSPT